ncbi:NrfD/PsrC family molybdoenzyme membrane anchor subunit [Pasteurellaceae bacterium 22721_9_1]
MTIREILVEPQGVTWLPWAVSYFFFIGLSFSSVFIAFFLYQREKHISKEFIAIGVALVCAFVASIALIADLHQPSRIINFYLHPTPWSWMAWGALFLPFFIFCLLTYFVCLLRQVIPMDILPKWLHVLYKGQLNLPRWVSVCRLSSLILGLLILLYTTMEVFVVAAHPLWHQYWLMPLILFSVLPTASMLCEFCIQLCLPTQTSTLLHRINLVSLVLLICSIIGLYFFSNQTALQLTQLWQSSGLPLIICLLIGLLMLFVSLPNNFITRLLNLLMAVGMTWLVRWVLLIQVQLLSKYSAAIHPYTLNWEVDGIIGILAMFSLWFFITFVFWQYVYRQLYLQNGVQSMVGGQYE